MFAFALHAFSAEVAFTAPEGYADGGLDGQNGWTASTGGGGFVVDTSATTVSRSTDWGVATYGAQTLFGSGASEGDSATVTVDFYYEGVMDDANNIKGTFSFSDNSNHQHFYMYSSAFASTLQVRNNENSASVVGAGIPLPGTNDALRISYTLTLGADASNSVMSVTLSNTVSGASAEGGYTGISEAVYASAASTGLYFRYGNGVLAGATALVIDHVTLDEAAAPEPPTWVEVFNETFDDYNNGYDLNWTADWKQLNNSGYMVCSNGLVMNRQGLGVGGGWRGVMQTANTISNVLAGDTIRISFDYKVYTDGAQNQNFSDLVLSTSYADAAINFGTAGVLGARMSQTFANGYRIESYVDSPLADDLNTDLSNLGLAPGSDDESDWMRITYEALKTTNSGVWSVSMTVSNMATAASYSVTNVTVNNSTAYDASELYLGFYGATAFAGNEGFEMDNLYVVLDSPPPPVLFGYDAFADQYGLSGVPTDDEDSDGLSDWGEWVFGGVPTDSGDIGTLPLIAAGGSEYIFSLRNDDSIRYAVLTTEDLVAGSWTTGAWANVTNNDEEMSSITNAVSQTAGQLFLKLLVEPQP